MDFLHCRTCSEAVRILPEVEPAADEDLASFRDRHGGCDVERLSPTGRALADRPWHEPLAERLVEVRGPRGGALLVGRRSCLDQAIRWTVVEGDAAESLEIDLDMQEFWAALDRALYPHHIPMASLRQWAAHVGQVVRSLSAAEVVVLEDDPERPWVSRGMLTPTASARIQSSIGSFGVDATTEERLSSAFEGARFPPLRITRRLVTASPGPGGGGEGRVSAGGGVPPAES